MAPSMPNPLSCFMHRPRYECCSLVSESLQIEQAINTATFELSIRSLRKGNDFDRNCGGANGKLNRLRDMPEVGDRHRLFDLGRK